MNKHILYLISWIAGLALLLPACAGTPAAPVETTAPVPPSATPVPPTATLVPPTATSTPESTDTPEPTATATSTPDKTATALAEATQAAEVIIGEIGKELETVGLSADTGYLLWAQDEPVAVDLDEYQEWTNDPFAEGLPASDFVLKSDITWESTSGLITCGFFFRSEKNIDEGKQYVYEMIRLSGAPQYAISFMEYGQYQKSISNVHTNSAIQQEQNSTNKVVLIAEGEKFTLYINDIRAGSFFDYSKSMLEGFFAYSAWQESGESTCTFADTWVWALK